MKIAYLFALKTQGGAETLMLDIFRNARAYDLDIMGIYRRTGVMENDFIDSGVPVMHLSFRQNRFSYLFKLRKLLVSNRVEIIHAQQPLDALLGWLACRGTGIRTVFTLHGYDTVRGLTNKILRFIIRKTDVNIYVSATQKEYYIRKYTLNSAKQLLVYNGIAFGKLDACVWKSVREELGISEKTLLLGSVGNFLPVRDHYMICKSLLALREKFSDFHCVFVGKRVESEPELYDQCVSFCKLHGLEKNVSFLGYRKDVYNILHQLDLFLYASEHDTFGIAVVEAMATGIPVFVNDWEVMTEITGGGKYATLYKTKDEQDIVRHLMLFLQDKTVYQLKATQAAAFVRERYNIEKHIEELKKVYQLTVNS